MEEGSILYLKKMKNEIRKFWRYDLFILTQRYIYKYKYVLKKTIEKYTLIPLTATTYLREFCSDFNETWLKI